MKNVRLVLMLAGAWLVAGVAVAQVPVPPEPPIPEQPEDPTRPMPDPAHDPEPQQLPPPAEPRDPNIPTDPTTSRSPPRPDEAGGDGMVRPDGASEMTDPSRASRLIGTDVVSPAGEMLGKVKDVVLDRSGRATHALVAYTAPGNRQRLTAVPWTMIMTILRGDTIVIERFRLERAPSFTADTLPNFHSAAWRNEVDRYWSTIRSASAPPGAEGTAESPRETPQPEDEEEE